MRVAIDVTPLQGAVTGVGQALKGLLAALPGSAPDVEVAPWELTRRAVPVVPASGPSPVDGPYVLAIGTVVPRKGFDTLVRAVAEAGLRLVLAGADGSGTPAVDEAVTATGADVIRVPSPDDATTAALLRGARVLAYPSREEGFGLPPLEAMSVGVPVVTTRCGVEEIVGDAALVVDVDGVHGLADALTAAHDDDSAHASLVEAGRARAASFTWERTARGPAELWRSAAGNRPVASQPLPPRGVTSHARGPELARGGAGAVTAAPEFGRDALVRAGFEPARVHVAPLGVAAGAEQTPAEVQAALNRLGVRPPYVLFVST